MDRKERLKQVMIDEAETIRKVAERVDYNVMAQITELLCQVKKNSKKVILAGCGAVGLLGLKGEGMGRKRRKKYRHR